MNTDELRNLDSEKLQSQLKEHYEELFNLRFQQVMGKLTASGRPRIVKREIARIKTILRERELGL
ncbi:50S ribosomal protein L29 [Kouleothrix aurantiaca]|jgi:large subunit ribosomal protein L29|uniref:Large ribosomal subunit protein uL29 n=1 Tax=Kouleothrix aurantiaca TaxID=186479 RepID=A0A0P9H506_9CHLR|nr:50S ribosomal protein L29 [Kouleothrix aurantiaca]MBS1967859.1 50S ribosomal protein L29 [Chloroflexi bacterium SZAS-1]HNP86682.1 50S ribosomal protein L29 [Kouleothrix sp.]